MASSMRQLPTALLMILMLLLTQSPRTTAAINKCEISCLLGCVGSRWYLYPVCAAGCLIASCKVRPPTSEDNVMQCKTGCIITTCMGPNHGPNDEMTKQCIISCADGCEEALEKGHY